MLNQPGVGDGYDLEWLGLHREGPGQWSFVAAPGLCRFDGKFYGGTGIAVATAVMEAETGRRAVWGTVQFAASADCYDRFECQVEVLAEGRRTSQLRATGSANGRLVFSALGATGESKQNPLSAQFGAKPSVPDPASCADWRPSVIAQLPEERPGWLAICDIRATDDPGRLWMRMRNGPLSRAAVAFLADIIPGAVVRAAGRNGAGTSLDNSIRFGLEPQGDWVLVDVDPYLISDGYVHGAARLWSEEGKLLGVASQTASVLLFD